MVNQAKMRVSTVSDGIWRVMVEGEHGFLDSDNSLPGLDCDRCSAWGSGRLLPLPREKLAQLSSLLPQPRSPLPLAEFQSLINRIVASHITCPIPSEGPFNGFLPGDSIGPFTWEEQPKESLEFEPFFRLGNLAYIVRGNRLMQRLAESACRFQGVWITAIQNMNETWGFLIDDSRERLTNDGLNRLSCPLCGRLDYPNCPEQKRRFGLLRSLMLKSRTLARELVPSRDIFITDYTHSWFVKQNIIDVFGDDLMSDNRIRLEEWSVVDGY